MKHRVPADHSQCYRRAENRLAGMDCNPYLGIAASLACGYLGIMQKREPRGECVGNAYQGEDTLPESLGEALELFAENRAMREVLGEEFCRVYETVKHMEYEEFLQVISPWEREHLLLNV